MSDPVIQSQVQELKSWYSPLVDSAKSYLRPFYDEGVEILEKTDRYVEEKKKEAINAYNYVVQTPAEKMAADALGYVKHRYPEQVEVVAGLAKKVAPYALKFYRAVTPDPIESFVSSQVKEFLQEHEERVEVLAEALGGEALVQSLNEFIRDETVEVIVEAPLIETAPVVPEDPTMQNSLPVQKKADKTPTQKTASVALVEEDPLDDEEIAVCEDKEIISTDLSTDKEPVDVQITGQSNESVPVSEASASPVVLVDTHSVEKSDMPLPVDPVEEGQLPQPVNSVETQTLVQKQTEEEFLVFPYSSDLSADSTFVLPVDFVVSENVPKGLTPSQAVNHPIPQPTTLEADQVLSPASLSVKDPDKESPMTVDSEIPHEGIDFEGETALPGSSSPAFSSPLADANQNPSQQIDAAIAGEVQNGGQPLVVPSLRLGAQAATGRDLQADEGETKTVANSLDAPLNDIPGSADKGFDSDRQGKDNAKELMFELAGNGVQNQQSAIASTLEEAILPSSLRADVFLTT